MSVWDRIIGQQRVINELREIVASPNLVSQSWLICGPMGSGTQQVARAFAAALVSPDQGLSDENSVQAQQVFSGVHPDVNIISTNTTTITINQVRDILDVAQQKPQGDWRIIIIEDFERMQERTTNVLLKSIEEPDPHTIWLLCAPSAQNVLPTIRSRTRVLNLAMPQASEIANYLESLGYDPELSEKCARYAQGNVETAKLYAHSEQALSDREELVAQIVNLQQATQAITLASWLIDNAKTQAEQVAQQQIDEKLAEFKRINGISEGEAVPSKLRTAYNALQKKDEVKRLTTRLVRDILDRSLQTVQSVYRDITVLHNNATQSVELINAGFNHDLQNLAQRCSSAQALQHIRQAQTTRKRLHGNGNTNLIFDALFCALCDQQIRKHVNNPHIMLLSSSISTSILTV